jgi:hypothetical protein
MDAGKVSHELAKELAEKEFELFDTKRRQFEAKNPVSDFDKHVKQLENEKKKRKKRR